MLGLRQRLQPEADARTPLAREQAEPVSSSEPLSFLELRVLAVGALVRLRMPRAGRVAPPLAATERLARLERLQTLWMSGCRQVIDEGLFHDIAHRHPTVARSVRARVESRP
ncbi:hypothetical protein H1W37_10295 [Stappia taiwanensis]|uniref:Uncharacterized protein n=1 Tax=Stappia taiwanensis TaxID=992267 RepID=A0A838XYD6_9HYPH|nr:hypothetical protein [Stappia taiwanensis]MBA4612044.1 hypothetical protein [Stappia taiwanensis]GGE91526.1 hypothetical protein GCM10007285_18940 [Stappia taiwanensis]